jgi:hypothetical protein
LSAAPPATCPLPIGSADEERSPASEGVLSILTKFFFKKQDMNFRCAHILLGSDGKHPVAERHDFEWFWL